MNWRDTPFAGGFVLTKNKYENVAHYTPLDLAGGLVLWCDKSKELSYEIDEDGNFVVLYGHFLDTSEHAGTGNLAASLLASWLDSEGLFHDRLDRLAGRFVLSVGDKTKAFVYHDATGLRSVYYSLDSELVVSHANLLAHLEPHKKAFPYKAVSHSADLTVFKRVRQLLPNFRLDVTTKKVQRYFPRQSNRFTDWTREERFRLVETIWKTVMEGYVEKYDKVALSLTGGMDSRLMLAMANDQADQLHGFTYGFKEAGEGQSRWRQVMELDYEIVDKLKDSTRLASHHFVEIWSGDGADPELKNLIKKNTIGNHGSHLIPHYRNLFEGDGWLHIRGTGPEIVRRQWGGVSSFSNVVKMMTRKDAPVFESRAKALGYDKDNYGYLSLDLAYWECRMGKWHSEILNETDAAYDTLLPMSVREIYEILLSFSELERSEALHLHELINRSVPEFNFIGMNDRRNLYEQWRDERLEALPEIEALELFVEKGPSGRTKLMNSGAPDLVYVPAELFSPGTVVSTTIAKVQEFGQVSLTVQRNWSSNAGREYFEWKILVDDEVYMSCDGALINVPVHVKVRNLLPGSEVKFAITVKRGSKSLSWEKATRTRIKDVTFRSLAAIDEKIIASADDERVVLRDFSRE